MKDTITRIMIAITLIAMLIGASSCYTMRTAQRQLDKAHHKYPTVPAKFCADKYDPVDSVSTIKEYIPGATLIRIDTVVKTQVQADTVTITKYITQQTIATDTLRDTKYVQRENKASLILLQAENNKRSLENAILLQSGNAWRKWAIAGWSLLLLLVIWRVLKTYLKSKTI